MTSNKNPGAVSTTATGAQALGSAKNLLDSKESASLEQVEAVCAALRDRAEALATSLLGPPLRWATNNMRYSRSEGLSVCATGPNAGRWKDWDSGECGDALDLIQHVLKQDRRQAVAWALKWLEGR